MYVQKLPITLLLVLWASCGFGSEVREDALAAVLLPATDDGTLRLAIDFEPGLLGSDASDGVIEVRFAASDTAEATVRTLSPVAGTQLLSLRPDEARRMEGVRWQPADELASSAASVQGTALAGAETQGFVSLATASPGVNGPINEFILWDDGTGPSLVIAGNFIYAGEQRVNNIARWDGVRWQSLGAGTNGEVHALAIDDRGNLIAGGSFTQAGYAATKNVARWNGKLWRALGGGTNGLVLELVASPGHGVYAGGTFTQAGQAMASRVAHWTGRSWMPLAEGLNDTVFALTIDAVGNLIAGGSFVDEASGTNRIALWDGQAWWPMASGIDNEDRTAWVSGLALSQSGSVVAVANLNNVDGSTTGQVLEWDGVDLQLRTEVQRSLSFIRALADGQLVIGGHFHEIAGIEARRVVLWDGGQQWRALDEGLQGFVTTVGEDVNGDLIAAGSPSDAPISRWDGNAWQVFAVGLNAAIKSIAANADGELAIGEGFGAGTEATGHIALWQGGAWRRLPSIRFRRVETIHWGRNGQLFAAGLAHDDDSVVIASWDGLQWSDLGKLEDGASFQAITSIAETALGDVVIGGRFQSIDGVAANDVAVFDGSTWYPIGDGLPNSGSANNLIITENGALFVGGFFPGGVARWDGAEWQSLGAGLGRGDLTPSALWLAALENGDLIAAGHFDTAGDGPARNVARWDGVRWHAMGAGIPDYSRGVAVTAQGTVFAMNDSHLFQWNGHQWLSTYLGRSGTSRRVESLAVTPDGRVMLAGAEYSRGGVASIPIVLGYGPLQETSTQMVSVEPRVTGALTVLTAEVTAETAPTVGSVSFAGRPGGYCTDVELTPINATTSQASCVLTFREPGIHYVVAEYSGGFDDGTAWDKSIAYFYGFRFVIDSD